jgi:Icc-related predicted phosphoesterase
LDADAVPVIDGVRFLGCTLWTDYRCCAADQAQGLRAATRVNDFVSILTSGGAEPPRWFTPADALERHRRERVWLEQELATEHDGPTVVVTHHGHAGSLHPRFVDSGAINASFLSDLGSTIERYQPALWIHGHVHDSHDYMVGDTRIVCNPCGYTLSGGRAENAHFDPGFIVELPDWTPRPKFGV